METVIWYVEFISCEGNDRWTLIKAPESMEESEIRSRLTCYGSCGDDPAEITELYITNYYDEYDVSYDFTN